MEIRELLFDYSTIHSGESYEYINCQFLASKSLDSGIVLAIVKTQEMDTVVGLAMKPDMGKKVQLRDVNTGESCMIRTGTIACEWSQEELREAGSNGSLLNSDAQRHFADEISCWNCESPVVERLICETLFSSRRGTRGLCSTCDSQFQEEFKQLFMETTHSLSPILL